MAARGWKIIFPAGREGRTLDSLDKRISRSMDSVETIVNNLASLGPGEGRLTASTTALQQDCAVPSMPRQLATSSLFRSRRVGKWGEASRPQPGEEMVRQIGRGWEEYRNSRGRLSNVEQHTHLNSTVKHLGCSTTTEPRIRQVGNLLEESRTGKLWQARTKEERIRQLFFPKDTQNTRTSSQELHILL